MLHVVLFVTFSCWVVFSAILVFCDAIHQIYFESDLLFVFLTAPVTIPALLLAVPIVLVIRYIKKLPFDKLKVIFKKKKNYNGVR